MDNISKIKISGTSYSIKDENACKVVELTQAQYDELPTTAKTSNSLFVITDATAGDLSNYYTKTETDGLLDTKLDVTAYTPTDLSNYYTKSETSGATEISTALASKADTATTYTKTETDNAITAATSTKQDTLVSGTNIKTINNESILGEGNITIQGGGGKAISAGTNISITTGETADTINCTLPITLIKQGASTFGDKDNLTIFNLNETNEIKHTGTTDNIIIGHSNKIGNDFDPSSNNFILGNYNNLNQGLSGKNPKFNFIVGDNNTIGKSYRENVRYTALFGTYLTPKNNYEYDFGKYNNSVSGSSTFGDSGNTLFSVGNGTADNARHNAFEIRQNGDIYISKDGQDVKLQDQLGGGGGSSYTAGDGIDITNDVISVTGKVDTSTYNTYTAATDTALREKANTATTYTKTEVIKQITAITNPINSTLTAHTADTVIHVTSDEKAAWNNKQDVLVSGANIKTINGETLLGEGNIEIQGGGGGSITVDQSLDSGSTNPVANSAITNAINSKENHLTNYLETWTILKKYSNGCNALYFTYRKDDNDVTGWFPFANINGKSVESENNFSLVETSAITTSVTSSSTDAQVPSAKAVNDKLGGLSIVKLTQSEYDSISTKDNSTLYVIVN